MVIGGLLVRGPLTFINETYNTEINAQGYIEDGLMHFAEKKFQNCNQVRRRKFIFLTTFHYSIYRSKTRDYFEKVRLHGDPTVIENRDIPVKFSGIARLDFFGLAS